METERFIDNGNNTVTDHTTGLMWQKEDDGVERTWEEAQEYTKQLNLAGYTDWRLPTIEELISIVKYNLFAPAIDTTYFPNIKSSNYWSSTTYADYTNFAWYVNFFNGHVDYDYKSSSYYVRCVRGGQ